MESVRLLARVIEAVGGLVILAGVARAFVDLATGRLTNDALGDAQRHVAEAVIGALGLMTAATLLKTIALPSWSAIGMFAAILTLRTGVKEALARQVRAQPSRERAADRRSASAARAS
jgi:uncharacterized membrane protein